MDKRTNKNLYEEILSLLGTDIRFYNTLQKIQKIPILIREQCLICYDENMTIFEQPQSCGHMFHKECISDWKKYKKECPMCRKPL